MKILIQKGRGQWVCMCHMLPGDSKVAGHRPHLNKSPDYWRQKDWESSFLGQNKSSGGSWSHKGPSVCLSAHLSILPFIHPSNHPPNHSLFYPYMGSNLSSTECQQKLLSLSDKRWKYQQWFGALVVVVQWQGGGGRRRGKGGEGRGGEGETIHPKMKS